MNATIGGVGVLLDSYAMKSLNIIEKIISNIKDYMKLKDNITLLPLTPQAATFFSFRNCTYTSPEKINF